MRSTWCGRELAVKPTQITELLANIKATFVSFFSILMFVALGVGVFLGISWAGPALQNAFDAMADEGQLHNYQVQFVYGLTDDDLGKLSETEGVSQVEAERQSFQTLRREESNYTVKLQSLGQEIDVPLVVEGELPTKPGELAMHEESAAKLGIAVGDSVTFEHDVVQDETESLQADSGDSAEPKADTSDGMQYLHGDTFKVTAIINSADYAARSSETYGYSNSPSGAVDALAWVSDDAFDAAAFRQGYPLVNVRSESLEGLGTFGDEYDQKSEEVEQRVSELGDVLAPARYDELHDKAQKQVEDGEKQIADGKKKIAEGEEKLKTGRAELDAAIAEGEAKLASAYQKLQEGEAIKASAEKMLSSARSKLNEAESVLDEVDAAIAEVRSTASDLKSYKASQDKELKAKKITQEKHDANLDKYGATQRSRIAPIASAVGVSLPSINHTNYGEAISGMNSAVDAIKNTSVTVDGKKLSYSSARELLGELRGEYSSKESAYNSKVQELESGWAKYYAGQQELEDKKAEGEKKLADGKAEVEKAKKEIKEKEPLLEKAKQKVAELKKYDWTVLSRSHNAGATEVLTFSDVTKNLSISMAALFIIVGLLVSYFAVSRIVHEQVAQIGTKKALGFRKGEITKSFLLYSGIAVLAGAIIGTIVGYTLVEGIIGGTLSKMFAFGPYPAYFGWPLFAIMTLLELALILGATYLACRSILKQHAVELLRGEKPPTGKARFYEKWALWDRLPLFVQTIVNNCVNDRRRMISTIVGVAGSAALIVTAITLNNDVMKSYDRQYQEDYGFNTIAYVDNKVEGAVGNVDSVLQAEGATTAQVFMKRYLVECSDGDSAAMRIVVPSDQETFAQLYHENPVSGGEVDLSAEGAWVSQAYGKHMGAKVGDIIIVDGGDGSKHEVPILGFYDFWLTYHEMVMGGDYFHKEFGDFSPNVVLAQVGDASVADLGKKLSGVEGFGSIVDDATAQYANFEMFSSVSSAVVAIYLVLAALMSIVVLLNLNVMFIDEKKRELIVLMINGFSQKKAKSYIAYDSIVLTVFGIIVGVILGCIMGSITVAAIEPSTAVFVKNVDAMAVIVGVVGSALLAFIMGKIALRRIPKFKLTDINKQ